jgi:nucleoside 2-deoxyribosyltransferase
MFTVYLAGYISGNKIKECLEWRNTIIEYYKESNYQFINPLCGHSLNRISKEGLSSDIPNKALVYKDYNSVVSSNLIIVNLNTFGEKRPLIGTICELAWAWYKKIPVIAIGNKENYTHHPFLEEFITIKLNSVCELLDTDYLSFFTERENN